ncbi:hypothetical protein N0V90_009587 [Kalmusia sp. IMI 367209]|nr:hypothetical protein N0V90_009587 [Kalmusia sp. IMI 367209]
MAALPVDEQYEYIKACGSGTHFILDRTSTPKAEFTRLAIFFLGWDSSGLNWRVNWKACFGEEYIWGGGRPTSPTITSRHASNNTPPSGLTPSSLSSDSSSSSSSGSSSGSSAQSREVGFQDIVNYFDNEYGTNFNSLEAWQRLCKDLSVDPVPESINKCRKALKAVYINIHDFVQGSPIKFKTFDKFRKYTIKNHKIFPLCEAKKKSFLRALLHELYLPSKQGVRVPRGERPILL